MKSPSTRVRSEDLIVETLDGSMFPSAGSRGSIYDQNVQRAIKLFLEDPKKCFCISRKSGKWSSCAASEHVKAARNRGYQCQCSVRDGVSVWLRITGTIKDDEPEETRRGRKGGAR